MSSGDGGGSPSPHTLGRPDGDGACPFCGATALRALARGLHHPRVSGHGPIDIHECGMCGSMVTWPVPTDDALRRLYTAFDEGIDPALRTLRAESPLTAWYARAATRAARAAGLGHDATFTWMDVGAGAGEIGEVLNRTFPHARGVSVDWHARPAHLASDARHAWVETDLNAPGFAATLGAQADLVIALAVLEHVRAPSQFLRDVTALVQPGGTLYLMCPDYGSLASRLLGRRWPFWIPGEHLNVPTKTGARRCIERAAAANRLEGAVVVRAVGIPYPLAYVSGFLGCDSLRRLLRRVPPIPLPVGTLEASLSLSPRA